MQTSSLKHATVLNEFGPFVCSLGDLVHCKASSPIPFCLFVCLFVCKACFCVSCGLQISCRNGSSCHATCSRRNTAGRLNGRSRTNITATYERIPFRSRCREISLTGTGWEIAQFQLKLLHPRVVSIFPAGKIRHCEERGPPTVRPGGPGDWVDRWTNIHSSLFFLSCFCKQNDPG